MAAKKEVDTVMLLLDALALEGEKPSATLKRILKDRESGPKQVAPSTPIQSDPDLIKKHVETLQFCEKHARGYRGECTECKSEAA